MSDTRRARIANIAAATSVRVARELPALLPRLHAAQRGPSAGAPGSSRSNGGSPVERQLGASDPARSDLAELDRLLMLADDVTRDLLALVHRWSPGRPMPNVDHGCEVLAKVDGWEPVYARTTHDGKPRRLGRWAYEFLRATKRLPTQAEARDHLDGKRVRRSA